MARKKTKSEKKAEPAKDAVDASVEAVEDAVIIEETEGQAEDTPDAEPESADALDGDETPAPEDAETPEDAPEEADVDAEDKPVEDVTDLPPAPQPEPARIVERKGGFVPMVLGGVVAGGLGYGAATYLQPEADTTPLTELTQKLEMQAQEISALRGELAKYDDSGAIAEVNTAVTAVSEELSSVKASVSKVDAFEDRISSLERAPVAEASPAAVAAYEKELEAFRKSLAEQRAEVEAIAASAEEKRAEAEASAQDALKQSALSDIQTSLETGSPFAGAVKKLEETGVSVPEALSAVAADGVLSVSALSDGFAPAARAALAAARKEDGSSGGFGDFLKSQLGARSIAPREGDDPDAVLSRIEAAAKSGQLDAVLTEAEALPDAAKAPLADWLAAVKQRKDAVDAAAALSQDINSN